MTDVTTQTPLPLHSDRQWNLTLVEFWLYRRSLCMLISCEGFTVYQPAAGSRARALPSTWLRSLAPVGPSIVHSAGGRTVA